MHQQHSDMVAENIQARAFSRLDRSFLGAWWWTVDRTMLCCVLALMVFGVALVATASPSVAQTIGASDPYHFLKKHLVFLLPSVFCLFSLSMFSPRYVWRFATLMLLGVFFMLVMVMIWGTEIKGAQRWMSILGITIQPSEFAKPSFAVMAAWLIALHKKSLQKADSVGGEHHFDGIFPGYFIAIGLYGLIILMLIAQPDLGMSVVITLVFAVQIFLAGLRFRYLIVLFGLCSGGLGLAYLGLHHVRSRIDRFLDPSTGDNYQVNKSLEAIRSGGVIGQGPGQGHVKNTLPDAHADFIFSVLAEEMGLMFVMCLMGLFLFIILRGFQRLRQTHDLFSMLAAGGLLSMMAMQSLIHMGSAANILPAKGMTLPFVSYGGSSMLSMSIAMGMVLALTRQKGKSSIAHGTLTMRKAKEGA